MTGKSIARNAGWNLLGQVAPIVVAIVSVPLLIHQLGIERFGFLGLAWALIGYAGVFDFGIGRALTRVIANHLGRAEHVRALHAARVGTLLMLGLGVFIGAALGIAAPILVERVLKIPATLQAEARVALVLLAVSMPAVLVTSAWRGVLEAGQEFARLNLIRMGMGLLTYLAPLAASLVWPRLEAVVLSVVAMRLIGAWLHARACRLAFGSMLQFERPDRAVIAALFGLGGWMSVSNIVSPLLSYLDRFIIAQRLTIEQVAYYATPYDLITRTLMLPYSLMAVIFPVLAGKSEKRDELQVIYGTSIRLLWVLMWPVIFTAIVLAKPLLTLWLGPDFAASGTVILQILAAGVFVSTLAQAPVNIIQATGAPKSMAILHLIELPIFIAVLWQAIGIDGVRGAAIAWAGRLFFDAIILFIIAHRQLRAGAMTAAWWLKCSLFCGVTLLMGMYATSLWTQLAAWLVGMLAFLAFAWWFLLVTSDRAWLLVRVLAIVGKAPPFGDATSNVVPADIGKVK